MDSDVKNYLSKIGRRGGRKSRRRLSKKDAQKMVQIREARRAFRRFHSRCFWSFDPDYIVKKEDIRWVGEQLMKNGDLVLWRLGAKLCR